MKKYIFSIISAFMLLLVLVFTSCENKDSEANYIDYGTSVFVGDGDAGQAGLSTATYPGYATFAGQLDNNSMTLTYLLSWNRLQSIAKSINLFMPADSAIFLPNSYYAYTTVTPDTIGTLVDKRTVITTGTSSSYYVYDSMLSDYELSNLLVGKWYYAINSTNNFVQSTTQSGEVRGQIKWAYTFFKNKPTVYFVPIAKTDSFTVSHDVVLSGNISTNDFKANAKRPNVTSTDYWTVLLNLKPITVDNKWYKTIDPKSGTVVLNTDGSFTYTPNSGFTGTDYFYYKIVDENSNSSSVTKVKVNVK